MPYSRSARSLIGKQASPLTLPSASGTTFKFRPGGHPVALFFFPAANTFGCIREACHFKNALNTKDIWARNDCEVIGISGNTVDDNAKFVADYLLPFTVLCDLDGEARKTYATGKGMMGMDARVTYFIDSMGVIRDVFDSFLNFAAHRKFVETWLERIELERQPWSKFLDYQAIMDDYDPGTIVGVGVGTALTRRAERFSQLFDDEESSSGSDGRCSTLNSPASGSSFEAPPTPLL